MWSNLLVACVMILPALIYGAVQWLQYRSHRADIYRLSKATGLRSGILRFGAGGYDRISESALTACARLVTIGAIMGMRDPPQKITFAEMRDVGVQGLLAAATASR
jgi:hypothetical protein